MGMQVICFMAVYVLIIPTYYFIIDIKTIRLLILKILQFHECITVIIEQLLKMRKKDKYLCLLILQYIPTFNCNEWQYIMWFVFDRTRVVTGVSCARGKIQLWRPFCITDRLLIYIFCLSTRTTLHGLQAGTATHLY